MRSEAHHEQQLQNGRRISRSTFTRAIRGDALRRHRTRIHGQVLESQSGRDLHVRLLFRTIVRLQNEIRFGNRLAQLFCPGFERNHQGNRRSQPLDGADRSALCQMREPFGAPFSRRTDAHGPAVLHQFRFARFRAPQQRLNVRPSQRLLVAMHRARRKRRLTNRDIFGAFFTRRRITNPFALVRDDRLPRRHVRRSVFVFDA